MRAYLIVNAGSPARVAAALASGADALVLAGGDTGTWTHLAEIVGTARLRERAPRLYPRIPPIDAPESEAALAALMPAAPDAIVIPVRHGREVTHLGALLAVHEAEAGLPDGSTRIVAILCEARGFLDAPSLVGASPRLAAIGWEAAPLAAALNAPSATDEAGWIAPLAQARGSVRLAAAAAGVEALDAGIAADDPSAFHRALAAARRDGFDGMIAHAPGQVAAIREG